MLDCHGKRQDFSTEDVVQEAEGEREVFGVEEHWYVSDISHLCITSLILLCPS